MLYSKIATIRGKQLGERQHVENECLKQDLKLELQMELERLKGMNRADEVKLKKDNQIKNGREVIQEQIRYRELQRQKEKEEMLKDRDEMNIKLKERDLENSRKAKQRVEYEQKLGLEVLEANRLFSLDKEKKKLEDQELDRKIFQYNVQKQKREDNEAAEKQRLVDLKEEETINLRKKQERAMDRNSELDYIRAKRGNENKAREDRKKALEEEKIRLAKMENMMISNTQQKQEKQMQLVEQAKRAKDKFESILKNQEEQDALEDRKQEERKRVSMEHNYELRYIPPIIFI